MAHWLVLISDLSRMSCFTLETTTKVSTSAEEEDILRSYANGVNSFITKPVSFSGLLAVVQALGHYWLDIVALPAERLKP